MNRMIHFFIILLLVGISTGAYAKDYDNEVIFQMRASPTATFFSELRIQDKQMAKEILKGEKVSLSVTPDLPYATLIYKNENYLITRTLDLYSLDKTLLIKPSHEMKEQLHSYLAVLENHHFGRDLPWKEVRKVFPRMGHAKVVDLETGMTFAVQRRAGSRHADVQPLTANDSKIMKKIYDGNWSWKRRAILVRTNGLEIAASMNGMPHGAGAIAGNQFPGHFCIHFRDSTTHKRDYPDPGHDYMVLKAAGKLDDQLVTGSPEQILSLLISAIQEKDKGMVPLYFNQANPSAREELNKYLDEIEGIKLESISRNNVGVVFAEIHGVVRLKMRGEKERTINSTFILSRGGPVERWTIEPEWVVSELFSPKNEEIR